MASDAEVVARIHVDAWRETYSGLLPDHVVTFRDVAARTALWREALGNGVETGQAVFIAGADGFVSCCAQRDARLVECGFTGEISALYTLRRAQGRGLGRVLFRSAMTHLDECGFDGAALWVLAANRPARSFYEHLGGRLAGSREDVIHHHAMDDVAYGWPDLKQLVRTGSSQHRSPSRSAEEADR